MHARALHAPEVCTGLFMVVLATMCLAGRQGQQDSEQARGQRAPHAQVVHGLQRGAGDDAAHAAALHHQPDLVPVAAPARRAPLPHPRAHHLQRRVLHLRPGAHMSAMSHRRGRQWPLSACIQLVCTPKRPSMCDIKGNATVNRRQCTVQATTLLLQRPVQYHSSPCTLGAGSAHTGKLRVGGAAGDVAPHLLLGAPQPHAAGAALLDNCALRGAQRVYGGVHGDLRGGVLLRLKALQQRLERLLGHSLQPQDTRDLLHPLCVIPRSCRKLP